MEKLYLAPIRGITDSIFRTAFVKVFGGFDRCIAPFVAVQRGALTKGMFLDLQLERNSALPIVPQILSNKPDEFLFIAEKIGELGYREINWNIGCPYPMVTKKGGGAGILPFPGRVDDFLETVMSKSKLKISIKMRIGLDHGSEIENLWPVLNRYPIEEITVHPRTAKQMYGGRVNLDVFEECIGGTDHKLVYNGDIETTGDFEGLKLRWPSMRRWMLGRGVLFDPFLPGKIKGKGYVEGKTLADICLFHDELFAKYQDHLDGPGHLLRKMQSIWSYLARAVPGEKRFAKKIKKAKNIEQYQNLIEQFVRK